MAPTLKAFLADPGKALAKGPVALIFAEDESEIDSTLRHHLDLGFRSVLFLAPDDFDIARDVAADHPAIVERVRSHGKRRGERSVRHPSSKPDKDH